MKKIIVLFVGFFIISFFISSIIYADEKITLSTYYPAPYGEYQSLAVDNPATTGTGEVYLANQPGQLVVEGNVGIGTPTPLDKLDIAGTTSNQPGRVVFGDAGNFSPYLKFYKWTGNPGSNYYQNTIGSTLDAGTGMGGSLSFQTGTVAGAAPFGSDTQTTRMIILRNGNVGIGTTTPVTVLTVEGTEQSSNNYIGQLQVRSTNNSRLIFGAKETGTVHSWIQAAEAGAIPRNLILNPNGGKVGIGITTPNNTIQVADLINFNNVLSGTFLGYQAGNSNTTGWGNTANGYQALCFNTTGVHNTATGFGALYSNTTGSWNTAFGHEALKLNTEGNTNAATGWRALYQNTTGTFNVATGPSALESNTGGRQNTATGRRALYSNTTGQNNTANGDLALEVNTTGNYNTAIGKNAGPATAYTNLSNTTAIGNDARVTASNAVRIGNSSVTKIEGQVPWSPPSDGRFKKDISEDVPGLDFILKLRPVTFHWNMAKLNSFEGVPYDDSSKAKEVILYTGFIAQEVESAAQEIGYDFSAVIRPEDEEKSFYCLSYSTFTVPLVKAVQELQAQNKKLEAKIEKLTSEISNLKSH